MKKSKVKRTAVFCSLMLALSIFTGCGGKSSDSESGGKSISLKTGVDVEYFVTREDVKIEITNCPSYGDMNTPYVYGKLTADNPENYDFVVLVTVEGVTYGRKPRQDSGRIPAEVNFCLQYDTKDGLGKDYNAEKILIFLLDKSQPDGISTSKENNKYAVPQEQLDNIKNICVCAAEITRTSNQ